MKRTILSIKPISQLFPIPMVMGCEGVSAAMLLQYNDYNIKATEIMKHWPKHPNNPYKGYVGHHLPSSWVITKPSFRMLMFRTYKRLIHELLMAQVLS